MQKYIFPFISSLLLALLVIAAPVSAVRAETLDDATIRKVFGEIRAAVHEPERTRALMQSRLDDKYVMKSAVQTSINKIPMQKINQMRPKDKAIDDAVNGLGKMQIETYQSTITSIQYSGDKKFAYVGESSTSTGSANAPLLKGAPPVAFNYDASETCSHIVALVQDQVKIMQSECSDQIMFQK